jgi:PAS domain S-box-containing protein
MLIKFSASAKLYLLIFITAASLIGLGLYGINDLKEMNENMRTLYADRVVCMEQLANIRYEYTAEILPAAQNVRDHLLTFSEAKKRVERAEQIINVNWHDYKLTYLTADEQLLAKETGLIKNQADKTNKNLESILSKQDTLALGRFVQNGFSTGPAPIVAKVTQLMELQAQVGKELYNNNKEIFRSTSKKFILLILLSLVIAISLSFYIIKNIRNLIKDRLKSNRIIKASEEKYRSLIEQASDAIYLVDRKGNFTEVNESMCKMTGYSREELLQLNVEEIVDPDQLKTDPLIHGYHLPDRPLIRERRLVRKDGTIFDVEINVKQFDNNKMLVIARDITDRKRMEAELKEAEVKFRTLAEKSMVGIYIVQNGKFIYVNPRFAEIFCYEPAELINSIPVELLIHESYREVAAGNVNRRISGEIEGVHYEALGLKKDGTTNWVEFYGNRTVIGEEATIIGTMIDISEKKMSQELILKEKQLSDAIINSLPGIFYLRNEKGKLLRWNQSLEIVTGYTAREIEGLTVRDMIAPEDFEIMNVAAEKVFSDGYSMAEARVKTKDGAKIPFLLTGSPIMFEDQLCLIGTGIDILSRIKAEAELRLSEQKYKLLFESNPSPMIMIAKDDMSIIDVNEATTKLYGYTKDELLQMTVKELRPAEDFDEQLEIFRMEASGSSDLGVVKVIRKDGSMIFVHLIAHDIIFEGRAVRLALITDVTERLKAETALKKSEANLQTILKTTDTAYALFDLDLKAQAFNQKAIEFVKHEYYHQPKKGDGLVDFFPLDRFPQFMNFTRAVLKGNNITYEIDYSQADGSVTWYYVSLFPITNDAKEILGMMMSLYDITERKNTEHDLKSAYERIQSHINSIKDMAWKQSHLIRSPLANLKGLAEMLKEDPTDAEVLEFIQNELNRMDNIIIEMADISDHDL